MEKYPPGDEHILPGEKENHLQNGILGGYVSFLEGIYILMLVSERVLVG